jgi:SAM-dependent methyltransferase
MAAHPGSRAAPSVTPPPGSVRRLTEWDARFAAPGFVYGTAPNDFLVEVAGRLPPGAVLCLGEGEGRNAAFLAGLGHRAVAVDRSRVGLAKARRLAAERGLVIEAVVADLATFSIPANAFAAATSIFCHLPPDVRTRLYAAVARALRPGGALVLEAYTPRQLECGTGGPSRRELLMTLADARRELSGLDLVIAREVDREVREGSRHHGLGAVVQVLAVKDGGDAGAPGAATLR